MRATTQNQYYARTYLALSCYRQAFVTVKAILTRSLSVPRSSLDSRVCRHVLVVDYSRRPAELDMS
jgi:hypothetical protein